MELPKQLPKHLFHYTSVEGVRGILQTKSVWASVLHFMNDSREWLYALDLMRGELLDRTTENRGPRWPVFLTRLSDSLGNLRKLNVCVFSLSAVPNQLSQWRAYCPPEGGYALEFDVQLLIEHLHRHNFVLRECCYDVASQKELVKKIAGYVLENVDDLDDEGATESVFQIAQRNMYRNLAQTAPILKHPDFSEEKEWRAFAMVPARNPRMSYHTRGSIAVPHYVLGVERPSLKFPIENVMVGPNVHQELAIWGMFAVAEPLGVNVSVSGTPFRNL